MLNQYRPTKANQFLSTERRIIKLDNLVENIILARPLSDGFYAFHVKSVQKSQPFTEILTKYSSNLEPLKEIWELDTNILTIEEPEWIYRAEIDTNRLINEKLDRGLFLKSEKILDYKKKLHESLLTIKKEDVLNGLYVVRTDFLINRIKNELNKYKQNKL